MKNLSRKSRVRAVLLMWLIIIPVLIIACARSTSSISKPNLPTKPDLETPIKAVEQSASDAGGVATKIGQSADVIDKHTNVIEAATPPDIKPTIAVDIQGIHEETDKLREAKGDLVVMKQRLMDVENKLKAESQNVDLWMKYANEAQNANTKLQDEIARLKDEGDKQFKRMLAYLGVICVSGIGISLLIAFFGGGRMALVVAAGFGITLAVSIAISIYMKTIALVTICILGVAFVGVLGYLGWQFIKNNTIHKELVQTNELTKQYLPPEAREHLFGYGAEPGKIDQVQTKATKQQVQKIRAYNGPKGTVRLAPQLPGYWRPPNTIPSRPIADPYVYYGSSPAAPQRETII